MFDRNPKNLILPALAGLLVIAAFLIGNLWTKVRYLEEKSQKQVLAAKTGTEAQEIAQPQPEDTSNQVPPISENDHLRGNPEAQIFLIEYSDFECPYCKDFHTMLEQILTQYGDKVAWVYRHYPLSFHPNAQKEAEASECAAALGGNEAFWQYADAIFERTTGNGTGFALTQLVPLAQEIDLDAESFKTCLDSNRYAQKVLDDMAGGQKAGVQGTPGTVLLTREGKTELIQGALPLENLTQVIDSFLVEGP